MPNRHMDVQYGYTFSLTPKKIMEILFQDNDIVAINKPSGLLVHRSMIDRHETRFAVQMVRDAIGQRVYPVHRLDKPTSGVLLFALSPEIANQLMQQFSEQRISKQYLAIVRGYTQAEGIIDHPLKEQLDKIADKQANQDKEAQPAITHYRTLGTVELPYAVGRYQTARYSLLEVTPKTGRKHQIRRHMKHIFHPIVGDTTHGDGNQNRLFREQFQLSRLLLAAHRLQFSHPVSGERITLQAPLDPPFTQLITEFGWQQSLDGAQNNG